MMRLPVFPLLVKPAGPDCNLACPYCFYLEKQSLFPGAVHRMSMETLERLIGDYLALGFERGSITFQGGEPLLMDEEFFRRAQELGNNKIDFSVQTNGTLLTPSLARFFAEHHWLVGVSVHDRSEAMLRGVKLLREAGADYNVLALITKDNVAVPEELYRYCRDALGGKFLQFIECVHPASHAITAEQWGEFLCRVYDLWRAEGDVHRISVRLFDSLVSQRTFGRPTLCQFGGDCRNYLVIEHNGDIYPCDFFVEKELRLGNLRERGEINPLAAAFLSPEFAAFGARKKTLPPDCFRCEYRTLCQGDCPRSRANGRSVLCRGWRRFFGHALC